MDKYDLQKLVEHMSLTDIWADIESIIKSGVDINYILSLGEPSPDYFAKQYEEILDLTGVDPLRLFRYSEEYYKTQTSLVKDLAHTLLTYVAHGLDRDLARRWMLDNIREEDIIPNAVYLEPLGIRPRDYVDAYLEDNYGNSVWDLDSLPWPITPDDVARHFSITELKCLFKGFNGFRYCGIGVFVDDFAKSGGNINILADKFLAELGYPEDEDDLMALAIMKRYNATRIDANKIIDALTYDAYVYKDPASIKKVKLWFLDMLIRYLDETHIERLKN